MNSVTSMGRHIAGTAHRRLGLAYTRGSASRGDALTHLRSFAHHQLGNHAEAVTSYLHRVSLCVNCGDRYNPCETLDRMGDTRHAAGQPGAARFLAAGAGHPGRPASSESRADPCQAMGTRRGDLAGREPLMCAAIRLLVAAGLEGEQPVVLASGGHQFLVGTTLGDLPSGQHIDHVGVADRAEPV